MAFDAFALGALSGIVSRSDRVTLTHAKSVLVALLYAALVVRFGGRGLVILTALQGVAVLFHLSTWFDQSIMVSINSLVLNAVGWAMPLTLVPESISNRRSEISK